MSYQFRRGFGVAPAGCASGTTSGCATQTDCSVFWMWGLNPACWQYSLSAWQQMAALKAPTGILNAAPGAPAAAYTDTTGTSYDELQAQATAEANAAFAAAQAANLAQSQDQAAIGSDSNSASDASSLFSLGGFSLPWWAWLGIGVGAVIAVRKATA